MTKMDFIKPYAEFLLAGAYNLQQSLEGFDIERFQYPNDHGGHALTSVFGPAIPIEILLSLIFLYALLLSPILLLASYALGRRNGILIFIALALLPGLLSVLGLWPELNVIPSTMDLDSSGVLGLGLGISPLLILGLLTGWAFTICAYDILGLGKRAKDMYDHIWYCFALLAAVFFVMDNDATYRDTKLQDSIKETQGISDYLTQELYTYLDYCRDNQLDKLLSCRWAENAVDRFQSFKYHNASLYQTFGPDSSHDTYSALSRSINKDQILQIRLEIEKYNLLSCAYGESSNGINDAPSSRLCKRPPAVYCAAYTDQSDNMLPDTYSHKRVALASECIIPTLNRMKKIQAPLYAQVEQDKKNRNWRWVFFVLFSIVVGGKVANATASAVDFGSRNPSEKFRIFNLANHIIRTVLKLVVSIAKLSKLVLAKTLTCLSHFMRNSQRLIKKSLNFRFLKQKKG